MGTLSDGKIENAKFGVSATCTRAAIIDGHTEAVFVATEKPCSVEAVAEQMRAYDGGLKGLHSAPEHYIYVHDDPFRPQPRRDRDMGDGMTTVVGRLREERVLGQHGIKYVLVSHNTKMGAGQRRDILLGELLQTRRE